MTRHLPEAERRAQIMRAARSLFVERGFPSTRMEDVAKRAQLSKGAVYFYFGSKAELFNALVEDEHRKTIRYLEEAASDPRSAAEKLVDVGTKYLDYFAGLKTPPRFFMIMGEVALRDEGVRQRVTEIHERFVDEVAQLLQEGMESGDFKPLDPTAVALMLKAFIDGLAGQAAIGVRPDVRRLSTDGVRLIMNGLLVDGGHNER
ncbi:MAG: TetR/AcrR family transcriptional regulator [Myxococcota bacterium]|nr:TetR/AcrR family transcriptional regulator [Myxococcota bacterium]